VLDVTSVNWSKSGCEQCESDFTKFVSDDYVLDVLVKMDDILQICKVPKTMDLLNK